MTKFYLGEKVLPTLPLESHFDPRGEIKTGHLISKLVLLELEVVDALKTLLDVRLNSKLFANGGSGRYVIA
jgi:hypothetical protein